MADLAGVYDATRKQLSELVSRLPEEDLERPVPATPGWTIRDLVAHLAADVECAAVGDFPLAFFVDVGSQQGITVLNDWTERQVRDRKDRPLRDLLEEWDRAAASIMPMLRGEAPWPDGVVPFASYVLTTDIGVHQHDVYGALGVVRDRDAAPVAIGFRTYTAGIDLKIRAGGGPAIRFVTERKEVVAGDGEPAATVRATRFELFRALSGRRSPQQIRAYEWDGDPEPFVGFFYPYGLREEALIE